MALCAAADGTTNSWMTQQKSASWFCSVCEASKYGSRRLLILDNFSLNKTMTSKDIAEELDADLVFIPTGYTA